MTIDGMYRSWFRNALKARFARCPLERDCLTLGVNEDNGSPFRVPLKLWGEHAHFEGPSGNGKTAALALTLEQLAHRGQCSIVVADLKGDSNELLAAVSAGGLPVKWFIDRVGYSTHTCNWFSQRFYRMLTPAQRAGTLGAALGNTHGLTGYGSQWFGGAAFEVMQHVFERAEVKTFRGLAEAIHHLIIHGRKDNLHGDIRAAGLQAYLDTRRLASVQALNVVGGEGIDLCGLFETPQVLYVSLPSAVNHDLAGCVFRLFLFSLFDAAAHARRKVPVVVCADEFQRGVSVGIDVICQQARSCGIQLILANQTIADLRTKERDLRPTVRNCCRIHWQFGEGDPQFQREMAESGGFYDDVEVSKTYGWFSSNPGSVGTWRATNTTHRKVTKPRLPLNEILRVTADPRLSFFRTTGDHALYQYGGYPQIVESDFHITREEYERRKALPWPAPVEGCIVTEMPGLVVPEPARGQEEPPPVQHIGRRRR